MKQWPLQTAEAMNAFYGNPDANGDGAPDPKWVAANLVSITPPYRMVLAWDGNHDGKINDVVKKITVHRLVADDFEAWLTDVRNVFGSQKELEAHGMHLFGGGFNLRYIAGTHKLSMHSWGAAWDFDPAHNAYKKPGGKMSVEVVKLFKDRGGDWGGDWSPKYRDPMHFQFARVK